MRTLSLGSGRAASLIVMSTCAIGCGRLGFELQVQLEDGGQDASGSDASPFDASPFDASPFDATVAGHVIVVTTTSDVSDGTTTSLAALQSDPGADGEISLREALEAANATPNGAEVDAIHFQIDEPLIGGGHTIIVATDGLPHISDGVLIDGQTDSDFAGAPIIELDGSGTPFFDNGFELQSGSDGSTIRGFVINRFTGSGIAIASNGNTVTGCYIGTNLAGTAPLGVREGVTVGGNDNLIVANVIGGAVEEAVDTAAGSNAIIRGNYLGTNAGNDDLGNAFGVLLWRGHTGAMVGGIGIGDGNVIAHNSGAGVAVFDGTTGHSILGNAIYGSEGWGIDLGLDGQTDNDLGDDDTGDNNRQNYPGLTSATTDGVSTLTVNGTLNSNPSTSYRVEFFSTSTDVRLAERFLGATSVTTDGGGSATFSVDLSVIVPTGAYITSTATVDLGGGDYGDSSELSATVTAL